jgi:hypothetical protein
MYYGRNKSQFGIPLEKVEEESRYLIVILHVAGV